MHSFQEELSRQQLARKIRAFWVSGRSLDALSMPSRSNSFDICVLFSNIPNLTSVVVETWAFVYVALFHAIARILRCFRAYQKRPNLNFIVKTRTFRVRGPKLHAIRGPLGAYSNWRCPYFPDFQVCMMLHKIMKNSSMLELSRIFSVCLYIPNERSGSKYCGEYEKKIQFRVISM